MILESRVEVEEVKGRRGEAGGNKDELRQCAGCGKKIHDKFLLKVIGYL